MGVGSDDLERAALAALGCHALGLEPSPPLDDVLLEALTDARVAFASPVRTALLDVLESSHGGPDDRRAAIERAFAEVRHDPDAACACARHVVTSAVGAFVRSHRRCGVAELRELRALPWAALGDDVPAGTFDAAERLVRRIDEHLHELSEGWITTPIHADEVAAAARRLRGLLELDLRARPTRPPSRWIAEIPPERRTDGIRWLVADRASRASWFLFFHESLAEPCRWDAWDASLPAIRRQAHAAADGELDWRAAPSGA